MIKKKTQNSDQKDWQNFLKDKSTIDDKEEYIRSHTSQKKLFKFDLHGYSIEQANEKISEIILKCHENKYDEILIITGKGIHSKKENDVYSSAELSKLQGTIPDFITRNEELFSKIKNRRRWGFNIKIEESYRMNFDRSVSFTRSPRFFLT